MTMVSSAAFLIEFIAHYRARKPDRSGTLINKNNQEVGYQLTLSENDYSDVKTYLLKEYIQNEDNPENVVSVTPLQLEIILDYISINALSHG